MKFRVSFIETCIETSDEYIRCMEIENKNYFYRLVYLLNNYYENKDSNDELTLIDKFDYKLVTDYFNININDKKMLNAVFKFVKENVDEASYDKLLKAYQKIHTLFKTAIYDIDIPITTEEEINMDNIIKLMGIKVKEEEGILKNLLILIELIRELKNYDMLILINLKQYLTNEELQELYKYAIYNKVTILLIDNSCYGIAKKYEKKLIIDDNLEEFVI